MQKTKQLFISVVMALFFITVIFSFPTGVLAVLPAVTIHTTDFIPDESRTNFNGFEGMPGGGPGPSSIWIEDGVKVEQINGEYNDIVSHTSWGGEGNNGWYANGGDWGYTKISLVSGQDLKAIGLLVGSGWSGVGYPIYVQYALLDNGNIVAQGEISAVNGQYLGFSGGGFFGGGFDAVLLTAYPSSGFTVFDGHYQALAIDSIEVQSGTFIDQTGVPLNTTITSNTITITGDEAPWPISIDNGKYSINGGPYTSASGTINNNDTVTVQLTSSGNYFTTTNATLTIDGASDTFSVITRFMFHTIINAPLNTLITSNTLTVSLLDATAPISIDNGEYSINGGEFTSEDGTVNNGDTVTVRLMSSIAYFFPKTVLLTIGEETGPFVVVTKAEDATFGSDGGDNDYCFIATAAFGSPMAGQVNILRQFRDRYLLTNDFGRKFVSWYYRNGPVAASWIKDKPWAKVAIQAALYPLIGFSLLLISGYLPLVTIGLLLSALLFFRFRPKKLIAK